MLLLWSVRKDFYSITTNATTLAKATASQQGLKQHYNLSHSVYMNDRSHSYLELGFYNRQYKGSGILSFIHSCMHSIGINGIRMTIDSKTDIIRIIITLC